MKLASVAEQYKKFPELKQDDVNHIIEWVSKQSHLPKINELEAILFLHSNYYKLDETRKTIEAYYWCRANYENFFTKRDVLGKELQVNHESNAIIPLPGLTSEGYKVYFFKFMDPTPSKFSLNASLKWFTLLSDAVLREEGAANGHLIVADLQDFQIGHFFRLNPVALKNFFYYLQEALPFRLKGLHLFNVNSMVDKLVYLIKPLMKKELAESFSLHKNIESVHKFINPEVFPVDYCGGKAENLDKLHESFFNHLIEIKDFFLDGGRFKYISEEETNE